jgi:putative nucleotidyltransferase with HDIG domain
MEVSRQKVKASQLTPGMTIVEVSELSFDFATLDPDKLKFIKSAFKGANAVITDESGRKELPVEELKEFDQLQEIVAIPENLKIAKVVEGMGATLEKNGLLEFLVSIPPNVQVPAADEGIGAPALAVGSDEAKKLSAAKVVEVHKFVETIEKASENRNKASTVVEEMLDVGRGGNFTSKGAEGIVNEILQAGSSPAMKAIAGLRGSDQTYAHCVDMSAILQDCYADILSRMDKKASASTNRFTLLSGFMHDIGKSEVPKDVLESTERFAPDSQEMLLLRNHTTYGAKILTEMGLHENIVNVAHYHHVKKDGTLFTSYPDVSYDMVRPITRLGSVVDVYQALIGRRKYKKNWVPGKAVEYILNLRGTEFDEKILDQFILSMGIYPVGSLVKLSTGDLAFVLMIAPQEFPERPIVAVVENDKGEVLSHHAVMDLMLEKDVSVTEVVDHYEHYSESEDQAYRIFQSIRVQ